RPLRDDQLGAAAGGRDRDPGARVEADDVRVVAAAEAPAALARARAESPDQRLHGGVGAALADAGASVGVAQAPRSRASRVVGPATRVGAPLASTGDPEAAPPLEAGFGAGGGADAAERRRRGRQSLPTTTPAIPARYAA